jgi:hypothetical protein
MRYLEKEQKVAEVVLNSTMHYVLHTEFALAYPLSEVWRVFKDMRRWYTEYTFEVVSGPSYQAESGLLEDQVLKVTSSMDFPRASNSDDAAGPQYFIHKTIKVSPPKEIVAVLSGCAYDWKRYTVFYVWRMTEQEKETTIFVDSYGEAELVNPLPKDELSVYRAKFAKHWHCSWSQAFVNLKKVMEADR